MLFIKMHNNNLACIIRECNIQFWMSIVKQDWLVKSELDPNRLACPNPKEFFFLIYFFIFCFVRALTSAVVKWHKGQIIPCQFQKLLASTYAFIVQNAFLLQYLCKCTQAVLLCISIFYYYFFSFLRIKE